jgi:hypothetical protein
MWRSRSMISKAGQYGTPPHDKQSSAPFCVLWHRNIKPIKGDGHEEIDTDEIAKLDRAIRAKCVDCGTIGQFRQHAARCERGGNVIGDGLLSCEIWWTLARNDRGELFIVTLDAGAKPLKQGRSDKFKDATP